MENVVFTQLSIPEFRKLIQQELEQFHKLNSAQQPARRDNAPGQAEANYVTKKDAARLISVCIATIDNARRAGKIKAHRIGDRAVRFDRNEVLALAKSHTNHKQTR